MAKHQRTRESLPTSAERQRFRRRLLAWYRRHGRDLPWRQTRDPYHILVSEVMLQQTQVDRVRPKYAEWLAKFPSLDALAAAPEADVTDAWYPLGYNIRPRRLHAIAREVVARYGGQLPSDEATLRSFEGIGPYTAGAVQSFAFGRRAPIVDTNVARVLFRVFIGQGERRAHAMKRHLWDVSTALLPAKHVFDFNQALMDLGAMVCVARNPRCLICPMKTLCRSFPFNPGRAPAPEPSPTSHSARGAPPAFACCARVGRLGAVARETREARRRPPIAAASPLAPQRGWSAGGPALGARQRPQALRGRGRPKPR
jgi:A/G-specific adenine glycosylase